MSDTNHGDRTGEYLLNTSPDLGRKQLEHLEILLDAETTGVLDSIGITPGQRCLDLGAGSGSITRWLAERTGPGGTILATDIDTGYLAEQPGVRVRRHDITGGVPPGGPFDLIHARLLLMHLSRREEVLTALVEALNPGGWLVIGEYSGPPLQVVSAPCQSDAELFHRMQDVTCNVVGRGGGISYEWAFEVDGHMTRLGLENMHSRQHSETSAGGSAGCLLHANYNVQAEPLLRDAGITEDELGRYRELMLDPGFRAWFYQFVTVRGQKPSSVTFSQRVGS